MKVPKELIAQELVAAHRQAKPTLRSSEATGTKNQTLANRRCYREDPQRGTSLGRAATNSATDHGHFTIEIVHEDR
jgi:hypothetical protein